jgi:superfamily II DNA/RNA helicase
MEAAGAEGVIAEFARRYTKDRKTLVFTPTVAAAERVAKAFSAHGLYAKVVHGSMPPQERAAALDEFENGDLQYVINCMILTEGVDLPSCSAIIMARPTKSQQLYLQILGRSLRLAEDKEDALIIDLVGATSVNGLVSASTLFEAQEGESVVEAKARIEHVKSIIQTKAQAVHDALTPEEQQEFSVETIVSGSFNLFDVEVEELVEQVKKAAGDSKERKERERVKKLPAFPAPGRSGSMLELDMDFLISLESWATLPQYKGSYAAGLCYKDKWYAFYCDKSKRDFDKRYGFICDAVDSFEEMEEAIIKFTDTFPGTAGAMYYKQNKLQPNHPKRNKKASAEQIKFMGDLLKRAQIKQEEWAMMKNKEMKQPNIGTVVDWIDYLLCAPDARKQLKSVKEYLREQA